MTTDWTAITNSIKPSHRRALHAVYKAVHEAYHTTAPDLFTLGHCTTVITALMSSNTWAWPVVGITHAALRAYKEQDFRHKSRQGITRAHLRSRIDTAKELLAPKYPVSEAQFIETLVHNDATVLCVKGENRNPVPKHIPFANPNPSLFASKKIGWNFTKKERDFLRALFDGAPEHNCAQPREEPEKKARRRHMEKNTAFKGVRFEPVNSEWNGERLFYERAITNWNKDQVAETRARRHKVRVNGREFSSTYKAFLALKLPAVHCIPFRKALKIKGHAPFRLGNKTHDFEINEYA